MRVVDPAADHVEEMHGDREVQALLPSTDEEPQADGTDKGNTQVDTSVTVLLMRTQTLI